ncbi:SRPBCC domain-containing protein [Chryseolinea sp. H1M3-3]|uniref:SRPBCC family protein n=1 Tax=Chryseolinea sp. H1M3-3 TaxID=3034144 RepID=UPI0023ED7BAC|nr:SRPBCC domain-containing protein [Chryseolinea sp. H1M3-3]
MPNIRQELIIAAPAEKVYSAITRQEGLSAWWTPDTNAKPEVGSIARFGFGPAYFKEMKITELKSPELVKWTCIAGADEWIGTTLTFKLEAGDKRTLLRLHPEIGDQMQQQNGNNVTLLMLQHDDWKAYTSMYAECSYTWGQFLRSLKLFCESGMGRPWPTQHRS